MTPKEKAHELTNKLCTHLISIEQAKQLASMAVNEIIKSREDDSEFDDSKYASPASPTYDYYVPHPMYSTYWQQVKQEIEKL